MAFSDAIKFNGVTSVFSDGISNNLLLGVQDFFSYGFLGAGAFQNITRRNPPVSGIYSGEGLFYRYRLRPSDDPGYEFGQAWEGFRNDWVWESGVAHKGVNPIPVSGVWVDDIFYKPIHDTYSHFVDYPNGRVVFDYPILDTSVVETSFTHRTVGVTLASEKFVQETMFDSYKMEDLQTYLIASSGARSQLGDRRLQLPFVALELVQARKRDGYQLGGGQIAYNDILFHVFADNEFEKNNIRDVILSQNEKTIYLPDRNLMKANTRPGGHKYPHQLDENGSPVGSAVMYPFLVKPSGEGGFRLTTTRIDNVSCTDMEPVNSWLHRSTIRATFSVIVGPKGNIGTPS